MIDISLNQLLPEVSDPDNNYKMFNDGSVEYEVAQFLYGLVRILKPKNILETGCYKGWSSLFMADALRDNGLGKITTLEIEQTHIDTAKALWNLYSLDGYINCIRQDSLTYVPSETNQLLFLDSEPNLRFRELINFYPNLEQGGYILIHDTPLNLCQENINPDHPEIKSWPFGDLPSEIKNWVKDGELRPFHFPSPRGMIGLYKTRSNEYKWK